MVFRTLSTISFLILAQTAWAQSWTQTDEFDYQEDLVSHSFTFGGQTGLGAYTCGGNQSFRVGSCGSGTGYSEVTLAVTPNADSIQLRFQMPWYNAGPTIYVDGLSQGTLTGSG